MKTTFNNIDLIEVTYQSKTGKALVDKEAEIKEGDWFYVKTPNISGGNIINQSLGNGKNAWSENILSNNTDETGYHKSHLIKIIAQTLPLELSDIPYLGIGREDDVEKLANELTQKRYGIINEPNDIEKAKRLMYGRIEYYEGVIDGYKSATKTFTEEDLRKVFIATRDNKIKESQEQINLPTIDQYIKTLRPTISEIELKVEWMQTYPPIQQYSTYTKDGQTFLKAKISYE